MNSLNEDISFEFRAPAPAQKPAEEVSFQFAPPPPAAKPPIKPVAQQPRAAAAVQRQPPKVAANAPTPRPPDPKPVESKGTAAPTNIGRVPPHSIEAEEYLLSCCLIDSGETLDKCIVAKLPVQGFYLPAHQVVYKTLWTRYRENKIVALEVLADDLRQNGQLDAVGGLPFLMAMTAKAPTTAQAVHFLSKVRELYLLRELIKVSTRAVEEAFERKGNLMELIQDVGQDFDHVRDSAAGVDAFDKISKSLADYEFPFNDPTVLLGPTNRYICRGGKLVIVAPSGTGKSVTAYQSAACWAIGKPFLGLASAGPLRSLIIQAEDDEGDIGEVTASLSQAMGFKPADLELFRKNVRIVRDDTHTGMGFIPALRAYVRAFPADLVWINPLVNFCPGMSEERVLSEFLCGLNAVNEEHKFAYVVTHHTAKPPMPKDGGTRQAATSPYARQYSAFGSSILTNWARAIINIESLPTDDSGRMFRFSFDKRGRRAGIVQEGDGGKMETVTRIRARHSSQHVEIKGRKFPMLMWELDAEATDEENRKREKASEDGKLGGRPPKFDQAKFQFRARRDAGTEEKALTWTQVHNIQKAIAPISRSQMFDQMADLKASGVMRQTADGRYWFPPDAMILSPYEQPPKQHLPYKDNDEEPWPTEPPPGVNL